MGLLVLLPAFGTAILLQNFFAQAERLGRDLDHFIVGDEFDGLLQVEIAVGHQADGLIGAGGAHVGHVLFADDVDVEVLVARMLADDHALVDLDAGADKQDAALLQAVERVGGGESLAVGDQSAGGALRNFALVGDVAVEEGVHHDGAARLCQHFAAQADDAAAGHAELHAHAA